MEIDETDIRLVFFDNLCLLVSKRYRWLDDGTAGAYLEHAVQWDILRGTARREQPGSLTFLFNWDVHVQRVIKREQNDPDESDETASSETESSETESIRCNSKRRHYIYDGRLPERTDYNSPGWLLPVEMSCYGYGPFREDYEDTGWEDMHAAYSSVRWQRIQLNTSFYPSNNYRYYDLRSHSPSMALWREVSLDEVNITIASAGCLLFDSVTLEDNPSERDEDELEYWYPRWKLLGLHMHGLYTEYEFPGRVDEDEYYSDGHGDFIPLSIENLNSLFGFCDKETGKAIHSKDLWEEISTDDFIDPTACSGLGLACGLGFRFLPLKDRYTNNTKYDGLK